MYVVCWSVGGGGGHQHCRGGALGLFAPGGAGDWAGCFDVSENLGVSPMDLGPPEILYIALFIKTLKHISITL